MEGASTDAPDYLIRPARPEDAADILQLIRDLADYEKLPHEVEATLSDIERDVFGASPRVFVEIAEEKGAPNPKPAGFALWFHTYSTFQGRHGMYLEDLYVRPEHRGFGLGRALMSHLARRCLAEGLGRLQWWVLDWNAPAIGFYERMGAVPMKEWTVMRVSGPALAELAGERG